MNMPLSIAVKTNLHQVPCIKASDGARLLTIPEANAALSGLDAGLFPDRLYIKTPFVSYAFIECPGVIELPHRGELCAEFGQLVKIKSDKTISRHEPDLRVVTEEVEMEFRSENEPYILPPRTLQAWVLSPCERFEVMATGNLISVDWDRDIATYGVSVR